jgi:hypothetical protein
MGDFKADSSGVLFGQDQLMANWQHDHHKTELTRLHLQPISYTYLGAQGQISAIDHIIIDDYEKWKEILTVNIIIDSKEYMELKKQLELANIDRRCMGLARQFW